MEPKKELKIGERVVILKQALNHLNFETYEVVNIGITLNKTPVEKFYTLDNYYGIFFDHEISLFDDASFPCFEVYINYGQEQAIKVYLEQNAQEITDKGLKVEVCYRSDYAYLNLIFKTLTNFFHFSMELGEYLSSKKFEIDEINTLRDESIRKNENEVSQANRRWNDDQDREYYSNLDNKHDQEGMSIDDPYNPKNWE